jgi:hypothetical protein
MKVPAVAAGTFSMFYADALVNTKNCPVVELVGKAVNAVVPVKTRTAVDVFAGVRVTPFFTVVTSVIVLPLTL